MNIRAFIPLLTLALSFISINAYTDDIGFGDTKEVLIKTLWEEDNILFVVQGSDKFDLPSEKFNRHELYRFTIGHYFDDESMRVEFFNMIKKEESFISKFVSEKFLAKLKSMLAAFKARSRMLD